VAYTPDWELIADALKRVIATGVSEDEAKTDLCRAVADGKIDVRVTIAATGQVFFDGNVRVPPHLKPSDFDWVHSRPFAQWLIGPRRGEHYMWNWSNRPIDLIELSTSDVSRILCGGLANATDKKGAHRKTVTTVDQETIAAHALASHLRENRNLTREEAATWCQTQGFNLSRRGFQGRVWPNAREKAVLPRRAPAGRKNKSSH
jgi:hypothetical protein